MPTKRKQTDDEDDNPPPKRVRRQSMEEYLRDAEKDQREDCTPVRKKSPAAGSSKAEAYLGPLSFVSRNTDADANLPSGINSARKKYPKAHFKAGHMLNAQFGGNGKIAANLTILTGSANTSMTSLDNRIKDAVGQLKHLFETFQKAGIAVDDVGTCRIHVLISASGDAWGDKAPDSYISKTIKVKASFDYYPDFDLADIDDDMLRNKTERDIDKYEKAITQFCLQATGTIHNRKPTS